MKAKVLLISCFIAAGLVLGGCGSAAETKAGSSTGEQTSAEKNKLLFWVRGNPGDLFCKVAASDVEAYNNQSKDNEVSIEYIPFADFATKYNAAFAGGTAPDLMDTGEAQVALRANMKQYAPLDNYISNWENKDKLEDAFLNAGKMDDGKTYGIVYAPFPSVFVWRTDFFKEAGLDPEKPPKDWNQLLEYAKKLTKKDGDKITRGGFFMSVADQMNFTIFARHAGSNMMDEKGAPSFNDAAGLEAMQFMKDIAPYSMLHNPPPGANVQVPFFTGQAAMGYVVVEQLLDAITKDPNLKKNLGISAFVPYKNNVSWSGYRFYAINQGSSFQDQAWDVIKFLMSEDRIRIKMKEVSVVPAYKSMKSEYEALDPLINPAVFESVTLGQPYPKAGWATMLPKVMTEAQQAIFLDAKTPKQALDDAVNRLKKDAGLE